MCACQAVCPGQEDVQSLLWSRETVVSDPPSAGGPLLGPGATDNAMIQLEPGRPLPGSRCPPPPGHPGDLGVRRTTLC